MPTSSAILLAMTDMHPASPEPWHEAFAAMTADQSGKKIEALATELSRIIDVAKLDDEIARISRTGEALKLPVMSPEDEGKNVAELLSLAANRILESRRPDTATNL